MSDLCLDAAGGAHVLVKTFFDAHDPNRASLEHWFKPDVTYPCVAAPRGDTSESKPLSDLLLVAGTASSYPGGPAVLATVARAAVAAALAAALGD